MQSEANNYSNKWLLPCTNYSNPLTISTNNYSIILNRKYSVTYSIPTNFHYKHYYNYYLNHNSILILLCAISSAGEIMGTFTVAEIPIYVTMNYDYPPFQYWDCYSMGNSGSHVFYYSNHEGLMIAHRIQPTTAFMDLWYTEYDEEPRNPNWRQHFTFVEAIDHFAIGFDFGY